MIYFIQAGEGGPIKIGYSESTDYRARLSQLQVGNHNVLKVIGVEMDGDQKREHELHQRFSYARIRAEWFHPVQQLQRFIGIASPAPTFEVPRKRAAKTKAPVDIELLSQIEGFIAAKGISPTRFGRLYANDPLFVFQLRDGREPRTETRLKVLAAMQTPEAAE